MPFQYTSGDPELYSIYEQYREIVLMKKPINSTLISVLCLNYEGNKTPFVSTNQCMNAYLSKYTSPLKPYELGSSYGEIWETLMKMNNLYNDYMKEVSDYDVNTTDVWWICEALRTETPLFGGHVLKYAYSIMPNGNVVFNSKYFVVEDREILAKEIADTNVPASLYSLMTLDPNVPLNVNNTISITIVNEKYVDIQKAVGNEPNIIRRVVALIQFAKWEQKQIDDYYQQLEMKNRGFKDMHRVEHMTSEIAIEYLIKLFWYNPTMVWLSFYLYERLIDHLESSYHDHIQAKKLNPTTWQNDRRNVPVNFWTHANHCANNYYHSNGRKPLKRGNIEYLLLLNQSADVISVEVMKEINNIISGDSKYSSASSEYALCMLIKHGHCNTLNYMFQNSNWKVPTEGFLLTRKPSCVSDILNIDFANLELLVQPVEQVVEPEVDFDLMSQDAFPMLS